DRPDRQSVFLVDAGQELEEIDAPRVRLELRFQDGPRFAAASLRQSLESASPGVPIRRLRQGEGGQEESSRRQGPFPPDGMLEAERFGAHRTFSARMRSLSGGIDSAPASAGESATQRI